VSRLLCRRDLTASRALKGALRKHSASGILTPASGIGNVSPPATITLPLSCRGAVAGGSSKRRPYDRAPEPESQEATADPQEDDNNNKGGAIANHVNDRVEWGVHW